MATRRSFTTSLSAGLLFASTSQAFALKLKDPCRGKADPPVGASLSGSGPSTQAIRPGIGANFVDHSDALTAIHRNFQSTIEENLAKMPQSDINQFYEKLSGRELGTLIRCYNDASLNSGRRPLLLELITPALGARQTMRLVGAAGFEPVYAAILRVAPTRAQFALDAIYAADRSSKAIQPRISEYYENPLDYSIKELYLSYRTAPKGAYSVPAAMYETATFAGTRLLGAFGVGYSVGTAIQQTWEHFSPSTWGAFSDFLGSKVDSFTRSVGSAIGLTPYSSISNSMKIQVGSAQEDLWANFHGAGPKSWYATGGDFGVTSAWQYRDAMTCK